METSIRIIAVRLYWPVDKTDYEKNIIADFANKSYCH